MLIERLAVGTVSKKGPQAAPQWLPSGPHSGAHSGPHIFERVYITLEGK